MTTVDITDVLENLLALPLPERSYIAEKLLVSLEDDGELSPQWRAELDARVQRRESGDSRSYRREEVRENIQTILG